MGSLEFFPGVVEAAPDTEPEPDLDAIIEQQSNLLARWRDLGMELKRRSEHPLPFDLALELYDLLLIELYP